MLVQLRKCIVSITKLKRNLEYICLTTLCLFLLYSKVNQPYLYIHLFSGFPYHLGHYSVLSRVPCAIYSSFSLIIYFIHSISGIYMAVPISQFNLPLPFGIYTLVLHTASLFLLCKYHLYQFFQIPYIYVH